MDLRKCASLLMEMDSVFLDYEVRLSPDEAKAFMSMAQASGLSSDSVTYLLLTQIDETIPTADRGPDHPMTGRPHHFFRIGRMTGKRVVRLELSKINFHATYKIRHLIDVLYHLGDKLGATFDTQSMNHDQTEVITFYWA